MGIVLTRCRAGCSWSETNVVIASVPGGGYDPAYIINKDTAVEWRMRWTNCSFPCSPCPSPQAGKIYFRKWNGSGWGSWTLMPGTVSACSDGHAKDVNCTGSTSFNMTQSVWYTRYFRWCAVGVYQLLCDHACTTGGIRGNFARKKRVIVV